jgi:hypothetical protein
MGPETCLTSRIWLASLCRTTSAQPSETTFQHFLAVVMDGPCRYKTPAVGQRHTCDSDGDKWVGAGRQAAAC